MLVVTLNLGFPLRQIGECCQNLCKIEILTIRIRHRYCLEAASVESNFAAENCYNKYSRRNRCLILKSNVTLAEVSMANAPTMEMYIMDNVIGR